MKRTELKRKTPLARSPLKSKSATKRAAENANRLPRCFKQRCDRIARIEGLCVSHAEKLADARFSRFVRDRDGRCTGAGVLPNPCDGPLAAAHIVGRDNHAVRYDAANCHALCNLMHHPMVDQHMALGAKYAWGCDRLGVSGWDELMRRSQVVTDRVASIETALSWLPVPEEAVA